MAKITKVAKLRIKPRNGKDAQSLYRTMQAYAGACNSISKHIFGQQGKLPSEFTTRKETYKTSRHVYKLRSQMACSAPKTVTARYKTVETQLKKQSVLSSIEVSKSGKEIRKYVRKDLSFLWKPIEFRRPQLELVRARDYSFKDNFSVVSLNTIDGRILADVNIKGFEDYFKEDSPWKYGTLQVVKSGKHFYIHVSVTTDATNLCDLNSPDLTIVGIDRGLRIIATTHDSKGETSFERGGHVMHKRNKWKELRRRLQKKGTRSAKRRLKKLSGRENRWMCDVNHRISKTLVDKYGHNTLFVIEDLTGVTFNTTRSRAKYQRYAHASWSFYDLEQKLTYKAASIGARVIKVSPKYTSQRCPNCGHIDVDNRDRNKHQLRCKQCGYQTDDDRAAAMNIMELGHRHIAGEKSPEFTKGCC